MEAEMGKKTYEQFAKEFETAANGQYELLSRTYINNRVDVRVKHNKCGHEYSVTPHAFLDAGSRCPKCSGGVRSNSTEFQEKLNTKYPGEYTVLGEYVNSQTKVLVRHSCGHEFMMKPNNALNLGSSRCPCTAKRTRLTTESMYARFREVDGGRYELLPGQEYVDNKSKIKVRHSECGHVFETCTNTFLDQGKRCPVCAGSALGSLHAVKAKVKALTGGEYTVLSDIPYVNNKTQIRFKHVACGHEFDMRPLNFIHLGNRCPVCSSAFSQGIRVIEQSLIDLGLEHEKEKRFHACKGIGQRRLRFDIFVESLGLLIEFDGKQHFRADCFNGELENFKRNIRNDDIKTEFVQNSGKYFLLRIPYTRKTRIKTILSDFNEGSKSPRDFAKTHSVLFVDGLSGKKYGERQYYLEREESVKRLGLV